MRTRFISACLAACLCFCASGAGAATDRVAVIINDRSEVSKAIGQYYAGKRGIPDEHLLRINVNPGEKITLEAYHETIRKPVLKMLQDRNLPNVDFIVTTKGVPLYDNRGMSVDSMLTALVQGNEKPLQNPYFGKQARFQSSTYKMFLVTRLDGYTAADAKALVDRALKAPGKRGKILIDIDPYHDKREGYAATNEDMRQAVLGFIDKGTPYILDSSMEFAGGHKDLMGYYSWGSNDVHFDKTKYLSNSFVPGAIAETVVSTSARTFNPTEGGQSLIADLIKDGISGVKGYTSEPYASSMARASIVFDRYLLGYTLAESFYMASPVICWKDVIIGDPLCAPYAALAAGK